MENIENNVSQFTLRIIRSSLLHNMQCTVGFNTKERVGSSANVILDLDSFLSSFFIASVVYPIKHQFRPLLRLVASRSIHRFRPFRSSRGTNRKHSLPSICGCISFSIYRIGP